jgi:uncharacterized membrane protein
MERIQYLLWLGKMAAEALGFFWWLTLPLLGVLVASLFAPSSRGLAGFRAHHWRILLLGIFPLAMLVLGAGFAQAGEGAFALKLVYGMLLTHLLLAGHFAWTAGPMVLSGAVCLARDLFACLRHGGGYGDQ